MRDDNKLRLLHFQHNVYPQALASVLFRRFGMALCVEADEWRETKRRIGA